MLRMLSCASLMVLVVACERAPAPRSAEVVSAGLSGAAADEVPPDGPGLFRFMLERIPELAMKVPCSCCSYKIGQCYHGACPTSCGPCNRIGRDVYEWHRKGVGDDEILARVVRKYRRR